MHKAIPEHWCYLLTLILYRPSQGPGVSGNGNPGVHRGGEVKQRFEDFLTLSRFHPLIYFPLPLRFGSRCARIFRLLLRKKHLEQKQVEDFAMIPAKEAKDMLYKMLSENVVSLQVSVPTLSLE